MRTAIKRVRSLKDKRLALAELRKTTKLLDQLASRHVIHKNNAANTKSRLTKYVNSLV
jgi:small subunit ribosomal protein S20